MNNINKNYKSFEIYINIFINLNEKTINQIFYFLKFKIFIFIDNCKEFHYYNV